MPIRPPARGTPWTPAVVRSRLFAWWDCGDEAAVTMTSTGCSRLADKGPNGFHMVQATTSAQPQSALLNGRPALAGNGSTTTIACDISGVGTFSADNHWVIFVAQAPDIDQAGAMLKMGNATSGYGLGMGFLTMDDGTAFGLQSYGTFLAIRENVAWDFTSHSMTARGGTLVVSYQPKYSWLKVYGYCPQAGARVQFVQDSAGAVNNISNTLQLFGYDVTSTGFGATRMWQGVLGEVVVLNSMELRLAQRIEGYLANKWGIPLNPGHPFVNGSPTRVAR